MSDKSKMLADQADARERWQREQASKPVIRCACCRKADTEVEVLIDMGPLVVCDDCLELALRAVMQRKLGR